MFKDWSYEEVEQKADAIELIGLGDIFLSEGEMPWQLADSCESGGSHRIDIDTNVWFRGVSESGIPIRWSFDIEPRSANGKGTYEINVEGCHEVLAKLKEPCRSQFQHYLNDCANAVEKQARELAGAVEREMRVVKALRSA